MSVVFVVEMDLHVLLQKSVLTLIMVQQILMEMVVQLIIHSRHGVMVMTMTTLSLVRCVVFVVVVTFHHQLFMLVQMIQHVTMGKLQSVLMQWMVLIVMVILYVLMIN